MKHLFIINPASGKHQDVNGLKDKIKECCNSNNVDYTIYVTKAPLDATAALKRFAASGEKLRAYACGGDGTLNEVVNGAVGFANVEITHFPIGTSNDFVRMFGAHDMALFHRLEALVAGSPLPIDLIECNGRCGINICSVGIDARVNAGVKHFSRKPLLSAKGAYNLSLVINLIKGINSRLALRFGGDKSTEQAGDFALVTACNGRFYGGGYNPVPTAEPDDGRLDFLIVKGVSRLKASSMVSAYSKGRYSAMPEQITYYSGELVEITSPSPVIINIDGEILEADSLYFKLVKRGVNFVFPKGSSFFASRIPDK
jgi:YegS/Rv2252/BmrU family lipid kinase